MDNLDAAALEQFHAIGVVVEVAIYNPPNARLDDEFRALHTRRGSNIEGAAIAAIVALGQLGDGVGLGVEHIGFGYSAVVLADVLKARGGTVVAIRDIILFLTMSAPTWRRTQ